MKKKFLALVMTLSMVLSLVPMTALATGDNQVDTVAAGETTNAGTNEGSQDSGSPTGGDNAGSGDSADTSEAPGAKTKARIADPKTPTKRHPVVLLLLTRVVALKAATPERAAAPKVANLRHLQNLLTMLQKSSRPMLSMQLWTKPLRQPRMVRELRCLQTVRQQAWS